MKKILVCLALLLVTFLLGGCEEKQAEISGYQIYCVNRDVTKLEQESYTPTAEGGEALIQELIGKMGEEPKAADCKKAMPDGIGITSALLTGKNLKVDFNGTYSELDHITEVFCRAAVVKTLLQVPEVETVEFTVNGQELADLQGNPIGVMGEDTFIDTKGEGINSYQYATLSLYFADEKGKQLSKEMRNVHYSSNTSLEKVVMEQLLQGPANTKLQAVIPGNTKVLDISIDKKICTVNFDQTFNQEVANTTTSAEATIYSIVNAICDNCKVTQVQILIEGDAKIKYRDTVDISKPFERNGNIIHQIEGTKETGSEAAAPSVGVDPLLQNK